MGFPVTLYNPQRPNAGFTLQDYMGGVYLTPTGETIGFDDLRAYVLSGFTSLPSAADVREAQRALGLAESGELDSDSMAAVVNAQLAAGLLPTGVPDSATLAAVRSMLNAGQGSALVAASHAKKKKKGDDGLTFVLLLAAVAFFFRGGD